MRVLRFVGGCAVTVLVVVLVLALVVFGLRSYNQRTNSMGLGSGGFEGTSASISPVHGDYMRGSHLSPAQRAHRGVVVTYGGSEGSADEARAARLAEAGYEVLALHFFGQENQKPTLANVPLEHFDEVADYIRTNIANPDPVTVIGTSKGAELALLLAQHGFAVDNVVAFAPPHFSYAGLDFASADELASFTLRGEAVPFASLRDVSAWTTVKTLWSSLVAAPMSYRANYEQAAANAADNARIDLSDAGANVVLFAGTADAMWQSDVAAEALCVTKPDAECHIYPGAGHAFFPDVEEEDGAWQRTLGGSVEANRAAYEDSERVVAERLAQWHPAL